MLSIDKTNSSFTSRSDNQLSCSSRSFDVKFELFLGVVYVLKNGMALEMQGWFSKQTQWENVITFYFLFNHSEF